MTVSGTSFSLTLEGGSSTVCSSVKPRIALWHFWNYSRRHSYRDQGTQQHTFSSAKHQGDSTDEVLASMRVDVLRYASRRGTTLPREKPPPAREAGLRAGVISMADEANEVATDVAGDVANDNRRTRQHEPGCKALQCAARGRQHLNTVLARRCWNTTTIATVKV